VLSRRYNPNVVSVVLEDAVADESNRSQYVQRYKKWTRMYESVVQAKSFPFKDASNLAIPLLAWTTDAIHSRLINPLFEIDDVVHVRPWADGQPSKIDSAKAQTRYLNWKLKSQMGLFSLLDEIVPKMILYGSWFVKARPTQRWIKTKRREFSPDGQSTMTPAWEQVYSGPEFVPVSPLDVLLPTDADQLDQAEHIIHRVWLTLDELVAREDLGFYSGVRANIEAIRARLKYRQDASDGITTQHTDTKVSMQANQGRRIWAEVYECCYRFDMDGDGRAEEWLFTVIKDNGQLIRQTELVDVIPSGRRPWTQFIYKRGIRNPYGRGLGYELDDIVVEINTIFNQMTDAGTLGLAPIVVTRTDSSAAQQVDAAGGWFPGMHISTEDPERDIITKDLNPNLSWSVADIQFLMGFAEKISTISDIQLGRAPDRPGMPRTYGQQLLLNEGGSEALKTIGLRFRESLTDLFRHVWWLEQAYGSPLNYFQVTGEDGQDVLMSVSAQQMQGEFEFSLAPISPGRNRMTERQQKMQAIEAVLPLLDRARVDPVYFRLVKMIWETFDLQRLEDLLILGEDPVTQEHAKMLRGERVVATPFDDHMRHMGLHWQFAQQAAEEGRQDVAMVAMSHVQEHMGVAQQSRGVGAGKAQGNGGGKTKSGGNKADRSPGEQMAATNPMAQMGAMIGGGQGQFMTGGGKR